MKIKLFPFLFLFFSLSLTAQIYNPVIDSLINKVNEDSLVSFVRILSGEDSVYVNGTKSLIEQRVYNSNDLAADYIFETLSGYNLSPTFLDYSTYGTNIVAIKEGTQIPDEYFMICAHYDAVTYHAADDNASGTATVLETARIIKDLDFPYSLVFALWDEEEIGLFGSKNYALDAAMEEMDIRGVINIDMIGWDSDDDGLVEIHTKDINTSQAITNVMIQVNELYSLGLNPVVENPGTNASDHSAFWGHDYGAVLLIEAYYNNDFNPYYHQPNDRISKFNIPYFHSSAQLAFGAFTTLAYPKQIVGVNDLAARKDFELHCYPNPAKNKATIKFSLEQESKVSISLINTLGQRISMYDTRLNSKGENQIDINISDLPEGLYIVMVETEYMRLHKNLIIID